ncbi:MAG TPA: M28 family peptidase [Elusimicrobiales bacterium]|nr:M28 family peptidase [Elusimicrobiales bacterium]
MKKKLSYYLLFAAAAYLVIRASTFGWNLWSPRFEPGPRADGAPERLRAHTEKLAGEIGDRNFFGPALPKLKEAEGHITGEFRKCGYDVRRQAYMGFGVETANVAAAAPGADPRAPYYVVGAHYDTAENPGADDNASAVAVLLELACRLSKTPPAANLRFVAFTNEEPPFFRKPSMGSAVYVSSAVARGDRVLGGIVLEMLGYYKEERFSQKYPPLIGPFLPNRGDFLAQVGNFGSRDLSRALTPAFREGTGLPLVAVTLPAFVPGVDFSDHRNFWAKDIPAVMYTDTAFYRNSNYHKDSDLPDTLDYARMAAAADGLEAALRALPPSK